MTRLAASTLAATGEAGDRGSGDRHAYVFVVLDCHRPLTPPARIALAGIDEVAFCRGPRRIEPVRDRHLAVRIDDPRMSSSHARLTRVLGRWVLEDAGSKNGTLINGVRQASAELADGDLFELGQTFFAFRDRVPGEPPPLDAAAGPGLATLVPELAVAFAQLAVIARSTVSVILEGETGTGKEVLARTLHDLSGRTGRFVAVNCGALPRELVESELFGHRRGAFSGATADHVGLVRSADTGTLFLDEIGDLPLPAQAALLRVLQEREVRPVGATRAAAVDIRVLAASHRSLDRMVAAGEFRADLRARLAGHHLELPPLRLRREDLGLLVAALLARVCPHADRLALHPRAGRALLLHTWPGNVRELEKCLERAVVLATGPNSTEEDIEGSSKPGSLIELAHLPAAVQQAIAGPAARDDIRRDELLALLREHGGNVTAVARQLGKARMQIQRWMKRYTIDPEQFRRG
jgi:DNA-binding NtrC family response regulator